MKKPSHNRRRRPGPSSINGRQHGGERPGPAGEATDDSADHVSDRDVDLALVEEELGDNDLADATVALIDRVRPYFGTMLVGLAAALVGFIGYAVMASQAEATRTQSWDACLAAMSSGDSAAFGEVVRRYPGTPADRWATLLMADAAAAEGTQLLFVDRQRAEGRLRAAVDAYSSLIAGSPRGLLGPRAVFGLAKTWESLGQLDEARRGYEVVANEFPTDGLAEVAAIRATELGRESTKRWYDWFATRKTTPPAARSNDAATPANKDPVAERPGDASVGAGVGDGAGDGAGAGAGAGDAARATVEPAAEPAAGQQ